MEGRQEAPIMKTAEHVFGDFRGRRDGLIRALTTDVERFYQECDPEMEELYLFGLPTGFWEVKMADTQVPQIIPEPTSGINFSKEKMPKSEWLSLVAIHSDAWLISLAFYFGACYGFDINERKRLFQMINELPTLFEVVAGKQQEQPSITQSNGNKSTPSTEMSEFETVLEAVYDESEPNFPRLVPKKEFEEKCTTSTSGVSDHYIAGLTAKIRAELMQEMDKKVDKKVREMMKKLAEKNPNLKVDIDETT